MPGNLDATRKPTHLLLSEYGSSSALKLNAFLVRDSTHPDLFCTIEIYGDEDLSHRLDRFVGHIVTYQIPAQDGARSKESGLGRFAAVGYTMQSEREDPAIQHIGTIRVLRHVETVTHDQHQRASGYVTYIFADYILDWPSSGGYRYSDDGTISLTRFRRASNRLVSLKTFAASAFQCYFYREDGSSTIRTSLPAFRIEPRAEMADLDRAIRAVRLALTFVYEVELKPLIKVTRSDDSVRVSSFPNTRSRDYDRRQTIHGIMGRDIKRLTAHIIKWAYRSGKNLAVIEYAVARYVSAIHDLQITQSFSAGCEAIEALYSELRGSRRKTKMPRALLKDLRAKISNSGLGRAEKKIALEKVAGLAYLPIWHEIREYLIMLAASNEILRDHVEKANFYTYRNHASHGRKIKVDWTVLRQLELMKMCFHVMLLYGTGYKGHLPMAYEFSDLDLQISKGGPAWVDIWE